MSVSTLPCGPVLTVHELFDDAVCFVRCLCGSVKTDQILERDVQSSDADGRRSVGWTF